MSRYVAETLDLTRLPPLKLVEVDYEVELAAIIGGITTRLTAAGIPYDVGTIESDPFVMLAQEFSYRKVLDLAALNDAGRKLSLVYAWDEALDHIAATYYADLGIKRLIVDLAADGTDVLEDDERFRRRILLAPEARTPGTLGGYEYWALTIAPRLTDACALNHASGLVAPGQIMVVLLGAEDEAEQIAIAQDYLLNRNIKLATDEVTVLAADRTEVEIVAELSIRRGPSPDLVVAEAKSKLDAYVGERRRIGKELATSGIHAALFVGGVEKVVVTTPTDDVDPGVKGVVDVTDVTINTAVIGD